MGDVPNIIFLFGSGLSVSVGIPTSEGIMRQIENRLETDSSWKRYQGLYQIIKSGLKYAQTSYGRSSQIIHAELIMSMLENFEMNRNLYLPFIGNWSQELNDVLKGDFSIITEFRIRLFDFVKQLFYPKNYRYKALENLEYVAMSQKEPLRIFTTNFDKVIEENLSNTLEENEIIELGFEEERQHRFWNPERFFRTENDGKKVKYYLYKLHGSVDWERDEQAGIVTRVEKTDKPELIYGAYNKFRYIEPYLFLFSELRRQSLRAHYIISVGFSFSDEHINGIIIDAINESSVTTRLLAVCYKDDEKDILEKRLQLKEYRYNEDLRSRIKVITDISATDFLEDVVFGIKTIESLFYGSKKYFVSKVNTVPKVTNVLILTLRESSYKKIKRFLDGISEINYSETHEREDVVKILLDESFEGFNSWGDFFKYNVPLTKEERKQLDDLGVGIPDVIILDLSDEFTMHKLGQCLSDTVSELIEILESDDLKSKFKSLINEAVKRENSGSFIIKFIFYLLTTFKREKLATFLKKNSKLKTDYWAQFVLKLSFTNAELITQFFDIGVALDDLFALKLSNTFSREFVHIMKSCSEVFFEDNRGDK